MIQNYFNDSDLFSRTAVGWKCRLDQCISNFATIFSVDISGLPNYLGDSWPVCQCHCRLRAFHLASILIHEKVFQKLIVFGADVHASKKMNPLRFGDFFSAKPTEWPSAKVPWNSVDYFGDLLTFPPAPPMELVRKKYPRRINESRTFASSNSVTQ